MSLEIVDISAVTSLEIVDISALAPLEIVDTPPARTETEAARCAASVDGGSWGTTSPVGRGKANTRATMTAKDNSRRVANHRPGTTVSHRRQSSDGAGRRNGVCATRHARHARHGGPSRRRVTSARHVRAAPAARRRPAAPLPRSDPSGAESRPAQMALRTPLRDVITGQLRRAAAAAAAVVAAAVAAAEVVERRGGGLSGQTRRRSGGRQVWGQQRRRGIPGWPLGAPDVKATQRATQPGRRRRRRRR